jgi:hypothetical protein
MALQALGMVAAILLASPSYLDRLLRPTVCSDCYDFRGLDFFIWTAFLVPPALVLIAATWLMRPSRILAALLPLMVDLVVLGFAAYASLDTLGRPTSAVDSATVPVQVLQLILVIMPAVVTAVLALLLLNLAYRRPDWQVLLTLHALVVQVVAMVACVALSSPSLSDRLSSAYAGTYEGVGFVLWTLFLAPAAAVLVAAAWRLDRRRPWTALAPLVADIALLVALVLSGLAGNLGPPGIRLDQAPNPFGLVQVLLVVIPASISLVLVVALIRDTRRLERAHLG